MTTDEFLKAVYNELRNARAKFPEPDASNAALVEEVGELSTALMYEPFDRVIAEAVQVAAMACRIATEGDPTMEAFRWQKVHAGGTRYTASGHFMPSQKHLSKTPEQTLTEIYSNRKAICNCGGTPHGKYCDVNLSAQTTDV